jgi:hypothetical protein
LTSDGTLIFLTFGRVSDPSKALVEEGRLVSEGGGGLGRQVALIGPGTDAFRLNTPGWLALPPELASAMDSRAMLRTLCRDRLVAALPPFAAKGGRMVETYLDRVAELAGPPPERLDDLTHPSDRFFAALLPMSNVHIQPVTIASGRPEPEAGSQAFRSDLAFWDGSVLRAFQFGGQRTLLPRQIRALGALRERLGQRFNLQDLDLAAGFDARELPEPVYAAMEKGTGPFFGPYRARGFSAELPDDR